MALSERALTTVAAIERELGETIDDPDDVERWEELIEDASEAITDYLGRDIHRGTVIEQHAGLGDSVLLLKRRPIVSVTTVVHYGSAVLATSFEIQDAEAGSLLFLGGLLNDAAALHAGVSQDYVLGSERSLYTVTYVAGWITPGQAATGGTFDGETITVPRSIRRAALEQAVYLSDNPGGEGDIASEGLLSYNASYRGSTVDAGSGGLPASVRAKLDRYVDVAMG
jgi:hypothetical protein